MLIRNKIIAAVLLLTLAINVAPVHAEAVHVGDIEQAINTKPNGDQAAELRAKSDPAAKCGDVHGVQNPARQDELPVKEKQPDAQLASQQVATQEDCSGKNTEQVEMCDVTGTVCEDCGEVVLGGGVLPEFAEVGVVGGGFSISPLFSLAAIPLALLPILRRSGDNELTNALPPSISVNAPGPPPAAIVSPELPITPVAPPPPTPVPEPISLLLFGSGLSAIAAAMRRRKKSQLAHFRATDAAVEE